VLGVAPGEVSPYANEARRKYAEVANPSWKPPSNSPAGPSHHRVAEVLSYGFGPLTLAGQIYRLSKVLAF
jgi:hypothetical protein